MPDLYAGTASGANFLTASRQAEEAALGAGGLDENIEAVPVQEPDNLERPRDPETGRFVAPQDNDEASTETQEPVTETEAVSDVAEQLLAGRFKSPEELERGYQELLTKLSEQGNELGELRQLRESLDERFGRVEEQLSRPARQAITPSLIEQDPASATQIAYEQGDQFTLNQAWNAWREYDQGAADVWATTKRFEQQLTDLQRQADEKIAALENKFKPALEAAEQQQLTRVAREIPPEAWTFAETPEFAKLAEEFPNLRDDITGGVPAQRAAAVKALYEIGRGRGHADNLQQTISQAAKEAAVEAQKARADAYVASQDTGGGAETLTWEQQEQRRMADLFTRDHKSWENNWVGRK